MSALRFYFQGSTVRIVGTPEAPLFVVKDVCAVLELSNVTESTNRLDNDEFISTEVTDSIGRKQLALVVTESGLYSLILGSRKLEAKAFKKWVTSEVLPAIRRTGRYEVAPVPALPSHPEALRGWADALDRESGLKAVIAEQAPAVAFAAQVADAPNTTDIGTFAKALGWGPNKLFAELRSRGFLFYRDGKCVPKQRFIEQGWFEVKQVVKDGRTYPHTTITGRGQVRVAAALGVTETQPALLNA